MSLEPNKILSMTLSGIFEEIRSQPKTKSDILPLESVSKEENTLNVDNNVNILDEDIILSMTLSSTYDEIQKQEETNIASNIPLEPLSKEDTLSVDNNVNVLSINIVVAFCWWTVNYIIASVANICNYLVENPLHHDTVASSHQEKLAGADSEMDVMVGILAC
ncbi:MAG: hypothetical protein LN590_03670 [Rickettsia endosymbiont of Glossina mortisans submortisans]|nr:hypothetical protein [Rickettsia endosymbiont of Glossina mortisans submortisans]